MSRIMQVIEKKTIFDKGTVDLKLYQTGFISLTKIITDVPGQTVENAIPKQEIGYQFFHDLNDRQIVVRDYIDNIYKPKYNLEIDKKRKTVLDLIDFSYNWKSCVDYKSQVVAGDKADYRLFQKIVNAEKELYDYRLYAGDHIKRNCEIMSEWSKNRNYGSCLKKLRSKEIETNGTGDHGWSIQQQGAYIKGEVIWGAKDKRRIDLNELQKIPLGETDFVLVKVGGTVLKCSATRIKFNTQEGDDGYFTGVVDLNILQNAGDIRRFNGSDSVLERTGKLSPHFTKTEGVYDLEFFKSRKLI
ncbi:MAG: hypothetical protein ACRCTC_06270 [Cetobacterium sp.]